MLDLAWLVLAWAIGLYSQESRSIRFVAIAGATTIVWALARFSGAPLAVRLAILAVVLIAVLRPSLVGAATVTSRENKADSLLEHLDATSVTNTQSRVEFLARLRQIVPDDAGRLVAGRLRLWAAARRFDPLVVASMTSTDHFERAATRFLRDAQWRR